MNNKSENLITVSLAVMGSYLFYKQEAGVNRLIFTFISASFLIILNRKKDTGSLAIAILPSLLTSLFIIWYPQLLTRIIWFFSYLTMWSLMRPTPFPIVSILQVITSIIKSPISLFRKHTEQPNTKEEQSRKKGITYVISGIIILTFILLYTKSNPAIFQLVTSVDLSFIEIGFLITIVGIFLTLFGMVRIEEIVSVQKLNSINSHITQIDISKRDEQEFLIAKISIWILGIILTMVNISDLTIIFTGKLPTGVTYSEFVHQGFNTLIFTLSLAIGVIIYFFRGQLNFHKHRKVIKSASSFWIIQNLLLALITGYKNLLYVEAYGLTYKRIAVFLGLICVIIGLFLSFKKLQSTNSNWWYFNKLVLNAYFCLVLISFIPMDRIITEYNLSYSETVDIKYLLSLSKPDLELINEYIVGQEVPDFDNALLLQQKISNLTYMAKNCDWQSWNYYMNQYKPDNK